MKTMKHGRKKNYSWRIFINVLAIFIAIFLVLPFIWIIITSIQPYMNLASVPPKIRIKDINFDGYKSLLHDEKFIGSLKNTIIVSTISTFAAVGFGILGGYVSASFKFKGKNLFLISTMSMQMAPGIVLLIPIFIIIRYLNLFDSFTGLIMTFTIFLAPIAIWMLKGFFQEIPREINESAIVEGCTRLQILFKIILPLTSSGIIATSIFCFISAWCEFLIPLILSMTQTYSLTMYAANFGGLYQQDYVGAASVSVLSSLPTILLAIFFRKYIVQGLLEGAVKG